MFLIKYNHIILRCYGKIQIYIVLRRFREPIVQRCLKHILIKHSLLHTYLFTLLCHEKINKKQNLNSALLFRRVLRKMRNVFL